MKSLLMLALTVFSLSSFAGEVVLEVTDSVSEAAVESATVSFIGRSAIAEVKATITYPNDCVASSYNGYKYNSTGNKITIYAVTAANAPDACPAIYRPVTDTVVVPRIYGEDVKGLTVNGVVAKRVR